MLAKEKLRRKSNIYPFRKETSILVRIMLVLMLLASCIDEVNINQSSNIQLLVIDGYISTKPGPYTIKLSTTADLKGLGTNNLGQGANVYIVDQKKHQYSFQEKSPGVYISTDADFRGQINNAYQLNIKLGNGDVYNSTWQTIPKPVSVLSHNIEYREELVTLDEFSSKLKKYNNVTLQLLNDSTTQFFKIDGYGYSEQFIAYGMDCIPVTEDNPAPSTCWHFFSSLGSDVIIGTNKFIGQNSFSVSAKNIPVDSKGRFVGKLSVKSMNHQSYDYWKNIKEQLEQSGTMFDPPIAPIQGNIVCQNNDHEALGFFHTYSETNEVFCYDRYNVLITYNTKIACYPEPLCVDLWNPAVYDLKEDLQACLN